MILKSETDIIISICTSEMLTSRQKTFSGAEFSGKDDLNWGDIQDWIVAGGNEAIKSTLDQYSWDGNAVATILLSLSPDNRKVVQGKVVLVGDLMKGSKEVKANRLFPEADKQLSISYQFDDASLFTFNSGTMIGELVDSSECNWSVFKKARGGNTEIVQSEFEGNSIGNFSVRPYLVPLSSQRAKLTLLVFPLSKADLEAEHSLCNKAAFPGLEMTVMEIDFYPLSDGDGKGLGLAFNAGRGQ